MAEWSKRDFRLPDDHGWKSSPGYKIFVADRGAVRFDFPDDWVFQPEEEDAYTFHDAEPPQDHCRLKVSYLGLPAGVDWKELPLENLLEVALQGDEREILVRGEVIKVVREDLEMVWTELTFLDPNERREARTRMCLARGADIQPLITMDYWTSDAARFTPVWDEVLRSLQLGLYVQNPFRRDLH